MNIFQRVQGRGGKSRGIIVFPLTFLLVLLRKIFEVLRKFLEMQNIGKPQEKTLPEGRRGTFSDFLRYEALHEEDFWQKSNEEIFWFQKKNYKDKLGSSRSCVVKTSVLDIEPPAFIACPNNYQVPGW